MRAIVVVNIWYWSYNYLSNQCLSPLTLWVWILLSRGVFDTTLCDEVCQWLEAGRWFSPGTPASSTNKTNSHDIPEILLKVALNTIILIPSTTLIIMEGYFLSAWHVHVVKSPLITCLLIFYFTEGDIKKRDSKVFLKFSMLGDILLMMVISVAVVILE